MAQKKIQTLHPCLPGRDLPLLRLRCPRPPFRWVSIPAPMLPCPCWPAAAVRRSSAGSHGAPGWRRLVVTSDLPVVRFISCTATSTASPPAGASAVVVYMEPIRPGSPGPALLGTLPTTTSHLTSSTSGGKEVRASRQPNLRTVPVRHRHTGLDLARRSTAHAVGRVRVPCPLDGHRAAGATPNAHTMHAIR